MLLVDFDHFKLQAHKIWLVNFLTAASLLIAKNWKL